MTIPLSPAVVGHTNTGRISLLRTLLRDNTFGEVKNAPSTTRHVEKAFINDGDDSLVYLYDTPGLENVGGVLNWLETHTSARGDGTERIQQFLNNHEAYHEFNQEAKVPHQVMQSDMAMYVIDTQEPILNKCKDELTILFWCAKPIMPVFNFTQNRDLTAWTNIFARRTLHIYVGFDTVAFDFEGEIRLWDSLATTLPKCGILDRLINMRRHKWQRLDTEARREIVDFLLDVVAFTQEIAENDDPVPTLEAMQPEIHQLG